MKEGLERVLRDKDNKDDLRPVSLALPLADGNRERTHKSHLIPVDAQRRAASIYSSETFRPGCFPGGGLRG
ncbi:hypothetical protein NDU88_005700 [Pleurodeles waltl]|uniref:Uncharacterized protein n=1 Tax=Pleurodeles waltl TaxID=8319 RepID=A0AAV7WZH1_PLEWA|nr:hypothetical protein NDU88_005700 [Pleurodeles waltl]